MINKNYLLIVIILSLSLFSCIEQTVVINSDSSSGTVLYKINFNKIFDTFISYQNKLENFVLKDNLLFNKEKLDEKLKNYDKIKLLDYSKITTVENIYYSALFSFEEINSIDKIIKPLFIENTMYNENKIVNIQTRLSLKNFGKIEKIKKEFDLLTNDERSILETYLSLIKIKLSYEAPYSINSDIKENIRYLTKVYETYPANFFEFEILNKLLKREDRDVFNTLYKKDKFKNTYIFRQKISPDNIKLMESILLSIGYKNVVVFEFTVLDILKAKEFIEVSLSYKIY